MNHTTNEPVAQFAFYPLVVCVDPFTGERIAEHERDIPEPFPFADATEWGQWADYYRWELGPCPDDDDAPAEDPGPTDADRRDFEAWLASLDADYPPDDQAEEMRAWYRRNPISEFNRIRPD
jgi:hypothetical protein